MPTRVNVCMFTSMRVYVNMHTRMHVHQTATMADSSCLHTMHTLSLFICVCVYNSFMLMRRQRECSPRAPNRLGPPLSGRVVSQGSVVVVVPL
uniref:Uncharacterized protein n=1 Tax=Neolamprologus brichardi TaxID=32507 RepID=A0A3Q4HAR8_NEOBR